MVKGCPGVEPAEVVVDFIASFHRKFPGGIFWINCSVPEVMHSSIKYAEEVSVCLCGVANQLGLFLCTPIAVFVVAIHRH